MTDLVFLPDRTGRDQLTAATGFVRLGAGTEALQELADRLVVRNAAAGKAADEAAWRGTLALALLADVWAESELSIDVRTVAAADSPFASWVLASRPGPVRLVLLQKGGETRLLGVADAENGLKLPQTPTDWAELLPARVRWYDAGVMGDPVPWLTEQERMLLQKRMRLMGLSGQRAADFQAALDAVGAKERDALRAGDEAARDRLLIRLQAVLGLKDFAPFSFREEQYAVNGGNALVACFSDADITEKDLALESRTYLWDGVPFARTDSRVGLTDVPDAGQEAALAKMAPEIAMMSAQSTAWAGKTARALSEGMEAHRLTLLPAVRELLDALRQRLNEQGRQVQNAVTLTWPWDVSSGAVQALLRETLGDAWAEGAAAPFSDRLTKLCGHALGDTALHGCCACADGVLLPPLSPAMARCIAAAGEGEGLAPDALRFIPCEDGSITASFLLRGIGEVLMQRNYPTEEMALIAPEEAPVVAVWPCVPMENWHAYHVFAKGGSLLVSALRGGEWTPCEQEAAASFLRTETYPACITFMQDTVTLGALPNILPAQRIRPAKEALVAIDLGDTTTACAMMLDGKPAEIPAQDMTRILTAPTEWAADALLSSLTLRSAAPTAVALTGDGDRLFADGFMDVRTDLDDLSGQEAGSIRTALKWRADAASIRARKVLLRQMMQQMSLAAALEGAASIRWRVTIADEMDDTGRMETLDLAEEIARETAELTGLPLTAGKTPVAWTEESAALYAWLRGEGGIRGSFVALDLGGGSTKMHLWMQGKDRPVAGTVLLESTETLLLSALRAHPEMLAFDFADHPDEALQDAMQALEYQLTQVEPTPAENDKARRMLSALLDGYRKPIVQHMYARAAAQGPTWMQAVLLENQAALMFIAGLMLEQVGSDTLINHKLPQDMTVCLTGRGAWLLETLTPQQRNALEQMPRCVMRMENPVRFVSLKAAPQPEMSTARGLAAAKETGVLLNTPPIRTRTSFAQLMREMLNHYITHYPQHAWVLHRDLFDASGALTPIGEETISQAAARSFGDGDDIPASVMAFIKLLRQMPSTPASGALEDEF